MLHKCWRRLLAIGVFFFVLSFSAQAAPTESSVSQSIDQALQQLQNIAQNDQKLQALSNQMLDQLKSLEISYSLSKHMNKVLAWVVVGETTALAAGITYLIIRK